MDENFVATLLRTSADGFAGLAASRFWEAESEALGTGEDGFQAWKAHLREQVAQLAAAVQDAAPQVFANHQTWLREAGEARGVQAGAIQAALDHLGETLEQSLPADAWERVQPFFVAARRALSAPAAPTSSFLPREGAAAELAQAYLAALDEGDERGACDVLVDAVQAGRLSVSGVMNEVLGPVLHETGRLWHLGQLSIAEEHLTTVVTRKALARLAVLAPREDANGKTVVLGSVAGDNHDIGVQIVATTFELDGWRTICLGANTPPQDIVQVCERFDADLVALGATLSVHLEAVSATCQMLREHRPGTPILVGGAAFHEGGRDLARMGAHARATSPLGALREGRRLVGLDQ